MGGRGASYNNFKREYIVVSNGTNSNLVEKNSNKIIARGISFAKAEKEATNELKRKRKAFKELFISILSTPIPQEELKEKNYWLSTNKFSNKFTIGKWNGNYYEETK